MKVGTQERKRRTIWLVAAIGLIGLGLCVWFLLNPKRVLQLAVPEFNKVNYLQARMDNDTVQLKSVLNLRNRSIFALEIDKLDIELKLGGHVLLQQQLHNVIDIGAGEQKNLQLTLKVNIERVQSIVRSLQSQDSTSLELSINTQYKTFLGHFSFPYSMSKKIEVPVPPKLKVLKFERHSFRMSDKTMDATVFVEVKNEGSLNLNIESLSYKMELNNKQIRTEGEYEQAINIRPKSSQVVEIPLKVKIEKPLKFYLMILADRDKVPYRIELKARVNERRIADQYAPVELIKEGIMEIKKD